MHTALGQEFLQTQTHKCFNSPLHLHLMIDHIDKLDESCEEIMPHLMNVKRKMGALSYDTLVDSLTQNSQITFWRVRERGIRYDQYKNEIFEAIRQDVELDL